MIYFWLFYTFFKIGLVGFGGGYAMLSLIQGEVVNRFHWLTMQQFTDIVAISQMTPGPIGINSATYVGYQATLEAGYSPAMAILGSAVATLGVVLPSFILMFCITKLLLKYKHTPIIESLFEVIRPTVVGLIAAAALLLMTSDNFGSWNESPWHFSISVLLFVATSIGILWAKINPIRMILLAALAGMLLLY